MNEQARDRRSPVLVYGATGVRGALVARRLLAAGRPIRVLVRDPARAAAWRALGAEVAVGDLGDRASLAAASAGAGAVFFHLPLVYDLPLATAYGRDAVDAARAAGVERFVFGGNSGLPPEPTGIAGFEIQRRVETHLAESGLPAVVLRPGTFMDNFAGPWTGPGIVRDGVVAYPIAAEARVPWLSAGDAAAVAVAALARPDFAGTVLDLAGPEALTGDEVAARFAAALGRPVRYQALPLDAFGAALAPAIGATAAAEIVAIYRWLRDHGAELAVAGKFAPTPSALAVPMTTLDAWIRDQDWSRFAAAPAPSSDATDRPSVAA